MVCLTLCSERLHTGKMDRPQSNFQAVYVTATMSLLQLPMTLYFKTRFEMELFAEALILRYIYKICLLKKIRT